MCYDPLQTATRERAFPPLPSTGRCRVLAEPACRSGSWRPLYAVAAPGDSWQATVYFAKRAWRFCSHPRVACDLFLNRKKQESLGTRTTDTPLAGDLVGVVGVGRGILHTNLFTPHKPLNELRCCAAASVGPSLSAVRDGSASERSATEGGEEPRSTNTTGLAVVRAHSREVYGPCRGGNRPWKAPASPL